MSNDEKRVQNGHPLHPDAANVTRGHTTKFRCDESQSESFRECFKGGVVVSTGSRIALSDKSIPQSTKERKGSECESQREICNGEQGKEGEGFEAIHDSMESQHGQ